jgi:hypothetical protein
MHNIVLVMGNILYMNFKTVDTKEQKNLNEEVNSRHHYDMYAL